MQNSRAVDVYIKRGSRRVNGWMSKGSAELIRVVSNAQVAAGTWGSVGEIGVHHGRLFLLLYLLARGDESAFAVDVFEAQYLNVDQSGHGDRLVFEGHLDRLGVDRERVTIISESSLEVSPERLLGVGGPARLFSIDGGHTSAITLNDLALAENTLAYGGVVILDDVFQSLYPGVAAGLAQYLLGDGRLVPFVISPEKVLLTQPEHHDWLMETVRVGLPKYFHRDEHFFGHRVVIMKGAASVPERLQLGVAGSKIYRLLREAPLIGHIVETTRPTILRVLGR